MLITFRVAPNGPVRTAVHQSVPHLVAPCVALQAMVVNGHLVPAHELAASVTQWNGVPLVVGHPADSAGTAISANASPAQAEQVIGRLWNCTMTQGRLRGELWINLQVAEQLGGDVWDAVQALQRGEAMDVSTGFFAVTDDQQGTHQGRAYSGVYRNIRPDHLALLPHAVGACSWEDGCGAPRLHERMRRVVHDLVTLVRRPQPPPYDDTGGNPLHTHRTDQDIRAALYDLLAQEAGTLVTPIVIQFVDMDERAFVYRIGERVLMRRYTTLDDGAIALAPEVQSVQLDTRLIPVGDAMAPTDIPSPPMLGFHAQGGSRMDTTDPRITALVERAQCDTAANRTALAALPEALMMALTPVTPVTPAPVTPVTLEDALQQITNADLQATMRQAVQDHHARKAALVAALVAARCPMPEGTLQVQTMDTLQAYQQMMQLPAPGAPPSRGTGQAPPSYLGQGAPGGFAAPDDLAQWTPPPFFLPKTPTPS